ncbi:FG-GAP repeat domain-containing protein [Planctobacterium marinum]|uniref:FG-GAP repeat domain-containing protein n=1 Tax=Planctobacterium marinum TaxID=1631968 RepID=UPI001E2839A0|nr:VCBS repeat-containing protein [Planctobacterium marinum]MCC2605151.1 VCBS repeat-containing protein [Planctobacterium marinum]
MKPLTNIFSLFVVLFFSMFTNFSFAEISTTPHDYTGDGVADIIMRRASTYSFESPFGVSEIFGKQSSDIPVAGDFDGDGKYDFAVRRPETGYWYVLNSSGGNTNSINQDGIQRVQFGRNASDIPVVGDYDGDGVHDFAIRRPSNLTWYVKNSSGSGFNSDVGDGIQRIVFGREETDIPVPADYNGDGITDMAVWRPSTQYWYIKNSAGEKVNYNSSREDGIQRIIFGIGADEVPIPADYDGDGISDLALYNTISFDWMVLSSLTGETITKYNVGSGEEDIPFAADFDSDGKADFAIWKPSNQTISVLRSSDESTILLVTGNENDFPVATPIPLIMDLMQDDTVTTGPDPVAEERQLSLSIFNQFGEPDNQLSIDNPLIVEVVITDGNDMPLGDILVRFSLSSPDLATIVPASGNVLTGQNGKGIISLIAGNVAGAGMVEASLDKGETVQLGFESDGSGN